jgi:hypothetical protein
MKLLTALIFSVFALSSAFAAEQTDANLQPVESQQQTCDQLKQSGAAPEILAQQGCCSYHGGVCGCSGGRTVCCDGRLSPSCTCTKEEPPVVTN